MSDTQPIPIVRREMDTPLYSELVQTLGHDPLDPSDPSMDNYYLASQYWTESKAGLEKMQTIVLDK